MSGSSGWYVADVDRGGRFGYRRVGLWTLSWLEPVVTPELRDANATAGTWPEVIRLRHVSVVWTGEEVLDGYADVFRAMVDDAGVVVPLFAPDPERVVWRRRKWWGRGPIIFTPYGRAHRRALALCDCFIAAAEGWPHAADCATRRTCR